MHQNFFFSEKMEWDKGSEWESGCEKSQGQRRKIFLLKFFASCFILLLLFEGSLFMIQRRSLPTCHCSCLSTWWENGFQKQKERYGEDGDESHFQNGEETEYADEKVTSWRGSPKERWRNEKIIWTTFFLISMNLFSSFDTSFLFLCIFRPLLCRSIFFSSRFHFLSLHLPSSLPFSFFSKIVFFPSSPFDRQIERKEGDEKYMTNVGKWWRKRISSKYREK